MLIILGHGKAQPNQPAILLTMSDDDVKQLERKDKGALIGAVQLRAGKTLEVCVVRCHGAQNDNQAMELLAKSGVKEIR